MNAITNIDIDLVQLENDISELNRWTMRCWKYMGDSFNMCTTRHRSHADDQLSSVRNEVICSALAKRKYLLIESGAAGRNIRKARV